MDATGCPGQSELSRFILGNLPGPALARVAQHATRCPACEAALQALDGLTDPLLCRLRQGGGESVDSVPPMLLAAARAVRGADESGPLGLPAAVPAPRRLRQFELLEGLGTGS